MPCANNYAAAATMLRQALTYSLQLLLPSHCILCGLDSGSRSMCQPCRKELPRVAQACHQCARPGLRSDFHLCGACLHHPPAWDAAVAALVYEYPVNHVVQHFKFQRNLACGRLLAEEMIRRVRQSGTPLPAALIPVPLHVTRRFARGFNQAEILARELGSSFGIPVLVHRLRRTKRTAAQSGLDRTQRRKNIRGAFFCRQLAAASVALVDDVLTTGTTLRACARAVRAAGVPEIAVWVAARVPGAL